MKKIADLKNSTLFFDKEKNLLLIEPDSSDGFYFDAQDMSCLSDDVKSQVIDVLKK